eukprot:TRINITY_DN843_c0_g1_i1.p1 TRINITY_DN843_c0_g1~~TRINITY_DN843_c0_g1_i1.p1  ORF type:complete len:426 (+),score=44.31 TRINITY_DN843_c0_g1_i1:138-1415(+)
MSMADPGRLAMAPSKGGQQGLIPAACLLQECSQESASVQGVQARIVHVLRLRSVGANRGEWGPIVRLRSVGARPLASRYRELSGEAQCRCTAPTPLRSDASSSGWCVRAVPYKRKLAQHQQTGGHTHRTTHAHTHTGPQIVEASNHIFLFFHAACSCRPGGALPPPGRASQAMPAGRFGALVASAKHARRASVAERERSKAAEERRQWEREVARERQQQLDKIMETFDTDKSGQLGHKELKLVLCAMATSDEQVTDDEVSWLLETCDVNRSGEIAKSELYGALSWWEHYKQYKPRLQALMKKYDLNHNGRLDQGELHALLKHLNDGRDVDACEVDAIMSTCDQSRSGGLLPRELLYAIAVWYHSHADLSRNECPSVPAPPKQADVDALSTLHLSPCSSRARTPHQTPRAKQQSKKGTSECECAVL